MKTQDGYGESLENDLERMNYVGMAIDLALWLGAPEFKVLQYLKNGGNAYKLFKGLSKLYNSVSAKLRDTSGVHAIDAKTTSKKPKISSSVEEHLTSAIGGDKIGMEFKPEYETSGRFKSPSEVLSDNPFIVKKVIREIEQLTGTKVSPEQI